MLKKRFLSVLLCLCMVVGMLSTITPMASATTNGHTRDEAVAEARIRAQNPRDYDGAVTWLGPQCVDLIWWYYDYLGYRSPGGHATDYMNNWLPNGWNRYTPSETIPQPGDIVVFKAGHKYSFTDKYGNPYYADEHGHIAIVVESNSSWYKLVEFNGTSFTTGYNYPLWDFSCVIRPDWPSSQPTAPSQWVGSDFYAYIYNNRSNCNLENRNGNVQTAGIDQSDPRQIWHFIHDDSRGSYKIVNAYDDRCLDVSRGEWNDGTNIQVYEDIGSAAQRWWICGPSQNTGYGSPYYFAPSYMAAHQSVLDISNGHNVVPPGTNVQLWENQYRNNGGNFIDAQNFCIVKDNRYSKPSAPTAPANIWVSTESGTTILLWDRVPESGRYDSRAYDVRIRNAVTGSVLTSGRTTGTTFTYGESLTSGNWIAEVRAVNTKYASNCNNYASAYASQSFSTSPAYTLTLIASPEEGGTVNGGGQYDYGDYTTIQATPNKGYHFVRWEWPNGDWAEGLDVGVNVTEDVTITAVFKKDTPDEPDNPDTPDASGTCGEGVFWKYDKKNCVLTISGNGRMDDYDGYDMGECAPWSDLWNSVTKLVLTDGITSIGDYAFTGWGLGNIAAVDIPSTVTRIGECAFVGMGGSNFERVYIPASVTEIGKSAFGYEVIFGECTNLGCSDVTWGCYHLKEITVDPDNPAYASRDGVLFNKDGKILIQYPLGKDADSYRIPEGTETIGKTAFANCGSLKQVTIPKSVKEIEQDAFLDFGNIKDIYYAGSESDWNAVKKAGSVDDRDALKQAVIHYNSDTPDDPAVRITKTDIKADGVTNYEGYGSLVIDGDYGVDEEGEYVIRTLAQLALIDREGAFLFPYRDDPVGDGGYDAARFRYSDGIVSLTLGTPYIIGEIPQYYHLDGSKAFPLETTDKEYTEGGIEYHDWTS